MADHDPEVVRVRAGPVKFTGQDREWLWRTLQSLDYVYGYMVGAGWTVAGHEHDNLASHVSDASELVNELLNRSTEEE